MAGYKDPAIKLFGKTIKLVSDSIGQNLDSDSPFSDQNTLCSEQSKNRGEQKSSKGEEDGSSNSVVIEECKALGSLLNQRKNPKSELSKKEDQSDQTSSSGSQDQTTPKKPDKILPCPRCNSMNTKFCYFNNYNVNQPRHFCKNCQRYWTAGGTIRNVPVGAGRRKNKSSSSASHHRTLVIPNGLTPHPGLVLAFGPDNISPPLSRDSNCVIPIPWGSRIPVPLYATSTADWAPPALNWQCVTDSRSLGKHARDESERSVVIPKTLRIDDPNEAAKSSIWGTIGIKNEKIGCSPNGFFKGFKQSNKGIIDHNHTRMSNPGVIEGSHMFLQSNPAAFSRSITFHESAHPTC